MTQKRTFLSILLMMVVCFVGIVWLQFQSFRGTIKESTPSSSPVTVSAGIKSGGISAIDQPEFESVESADQYLNNDGFGIAIEQKGATKFYPFQILVWHHAVNDIASETPILISYSPLAGAGAVFERTNQSTIIEFGVTDRVHKNDLLLMDKKTKSLFYPLAHKMIEGELSGASFSFYPFTIMSWND
ncbi:MAG: DUF3179 domain-containing (seleno)protein, partial [Patescibacteria group bacterium]